MLFRKIVQTVCFDSKREFDKFRFVKQNNTYIAAEVSKELRRLFYIPEVMKNMIAKHRNMKFRERNGLYG